MVNNKNKRLIQIKNFINKKPCDCMALFILHIGGTDSE